MTKLKVDLTAEDRKTPAEGLSIESLRSILQDSHINLLVGAGASSPAFPPLGDTEELLTELSQNYQKNDQYERVRTSIQGQFFQKVLMPNTQLIRDPAKYARVIAAYRDLLRSLNKILLSRKNTILSKSLNIFTTNVDVMFEYALDQLRIDVNDGFTGRIDPTMDLTEYQILRLKQGLEQEYRSEIPVMNLYKIHGSCTWKHKTDDDSIHLDLSLQQLCEVQSKYEDAKPFMVFLTEEEEKCCKTNRDKLDNLFAKADGTKDKCSDETLAAFRDEYNQLSIVNPEKTKFATTVLNETYYELIRMFANELEKENSVLIVHGFSFRDEHFQRLVLRAARNNPTLIVLVFCYSRSACDDIRKLLTSEKIPNDNVKFIQPFKPVPDEDGNIPEEKKLNLERLFREYFNAVVPSGVSESATYIKVTGNTVDDSSNGKNHAQ